MLIQNWDGWFKWSKYHILSRAFLTVEVQLCTDTCSSCAVIHSAERAPCWFIGTDNFPLICLWWLIHNQPVTLKTHLTAHWLFSAILTGRVGALSQQKGNKSLTVDWCWKFKQQICTQREFWVAVIIPSGLWRDIFPTWWYKSTSLFRLREFQLSGI